jgi:hypothetical protein
VSDLDWTRLEEAVARVAARVRDLAGENRELRAQVARLEAELANAGGDPSAVASRRTDEVLRTLERLEGELEALL